MPSETISGAWRAEYDAMYSSSRDADCCVMHGCLSAGAPGTGVAAVSRVARNPQEHQENGGDSGPVLRRSQRRHSGRGKSDGVPDANG